MKKLISSILLAVGLLSLLPSVQVIAQSQQVKKPNEWEAFYKYVFSGIKYPTKAQSASLQGNSLILFSVSGGKAKDLKIETELGLGCDVEVLNQVLAYPNFKTIKDGKYALTASFRLQGADAPLKNSSIVIPQGYKELKLTIFGLPVTAKAKAQKRSSIGIRTTGNSKLPADVLVVVDGKAIENDGLNAIAPDHIESLSIIKDASAIATYGDKAKNGVIIVTTKKSTAQKEESTGNEPLFIIDGKPSENAKLNSIAPNNIESLSIIRDATGVVTYGSKAKNGVIVITTKKAITPNEGNSNNEPLYIIDGKEVSIVDIKSVAPSIVKNVTVLKDASSIATYGDKGKNGVILITTLAETANSIDDKKLENEETKIRIRPATVGQPVVIVDDKQIELAEASGLKPGDIQSVSILKGPKAMLQYGEEAKNGVIVIVTKNAPTKK